MGATVTMIFIAAAIIRDNQKRILICRRDAGGSCAYLWEFPGGKQEPGESLNECARRECMEELGIRIALDGIFGETTYSYPERDVSITFFNAHITKGIPLKRVHTDILWVAPCDLYRYSFCPADEEIIKELSGK